MNDNLSNISVSDLKKAIKIKGQLEALQTRLDTLLGGSASSSGPAPKRGMSAAGRKAIAAAQKRRWAKVKGGKPAKKGRKKMSAAGRAKIAAAARKRWAAVKAAGKKRL